MKGQTEGKKMRASLEGLAPVVIVRDKSVSYPTKAMSLVFCLLGSLP